MSVDTSPAPILQWFESSHDTMIDRAPDLFQAGYGTVWTPPPYRGDTSDYTVGYDVYDRFDLGQWNKPTLYGTEESLKELGDSLSRAGKDLHVDFIMNHNGYSTYSTPGFVDAGGYPGLAITLPEDIDGDFTVFTGTATNTNDSPASSMSPRKRTTNSSVTPSILPIRPIFQQGPYLLLVGSQTSRMKKTGGFIQISATTRSMFSTR